MRCLFAPSMPAVVFAFAISVAGAGEGPQTPEKDKQAGIGGNQSSSTIRLRVRVEDQAGKPLSNARGTLFKMTQPRPQAGQRDSEPVIAKAGKASPSKTDGYVETQPLPVKPAYVLEIEADGFASELTRWTHPTQSGTIELPPVQLRRLGTIAGTVVDRQGHSVPNVTVIQSGDAAKRLEAVTDRDGKFRLGDVPSGRAIVCFDAAGYRFHGTVLASPSDGARIDLERLDDANPRVLKPAVAPEKQWSPEQRAALVKKILDPLIARVLAEPVVSERDQPILFAAARLDPERIQARLDHLKFAKPYAASSIRYSIGYALINSGKLEAALDSIAKFQNPQWKLQAYLYWFDTEPAKSKYPEVRRSALAKARAMFEKEIKPADNPYQFCQLAAQLSEAGDHAGAKKAFEDCQTLLDKMPAAANGRDALRIQLAIAVSRENVERAKKLAADAEPEQLIWLASEVARHHPKDVEPFLADVPGDLSLMQLRGAANNLPRLCLRLARHDPAAAERILLKYVRVPEPKTDAEKMFGLGGSFNLNLSKEFIEFQVAKLKATCYALIAEAAVAHDLAAARHALTEGIELVKPLHEGFVYPFSQEYHGPSVLMAMLVPTAERIDPALAREVFWRALSVRIAKSGESHERGAVDNDTCLLANLVRLYDRPLAEFLLDPVNSRTRSRSFGGMASYYWVIRSLTLDSPDRALAWADSLSDVPNWDGSQAQNSVKQVIANVLSNVEDWDSNRSQRLQSTLSNLRNAYGVYVDRD
jgi:tetratricopeptide (TPR) repeat protein